ncbi:MAG: deoxynucleoside kinase [Bacilli bacterium]
MNKGKVIVIEGCTDGIGKSTQYDLLIKRLEKECINITYHHFPTYNTYQGTCVEKYLSGEYGPANTLSPYFINTLYAVDRAVTYNTILKNKYDEGCLLLLDRYTTSSLIYQSSFIKDANEKTKFLDYVYDYEYTKLELPKPDLVIFLKADFDLVNNLRNNRTDNDGIKHDIHESDIKYMENAYISSLFVCDYFKWKTIDCSINGSMRSIEEIHEDIYNTVKEIL